MADNKKTNKATKEKPNVSDVASKREQLLNELYDLGFIVVMKDKKSGKTKDFITLDGLKYLAHQKGFEGSKVLMIDLPTDANDHTCTVHYEATVGGCSYQDIGDASPKSVGERILPHIIRMASTRALARALRQAVDIGMTALEELGPDGFGGPDDFNVSKPDGKKVSAMVGQEPKPKTESKSVTTGETVKETSDIVGHPDQRGSEDDVQELPDEAPAECEDDLKAEEVQRISDMCEQICKALPSEEQAKAQENLKKKIHDTIGVPALPRNIAARKKVELRNLRELSRMIESLIAC